MCCSSRREQYTGKKRFAFAAVACNQQSLSVSGKACDARAKRARPLARKHRFHLRTEGTQKAGTAAGHPEQRFTNFIFAACAGVKHFLLPITTSLTVGLRRGARPRPSRFDFLRLTRRNFFGYQDQFLSPIELWLAQKSYAGIPKIECRF